MGTTPHSSNIANYHKMFAELGLCGFSLKSFEENEKCTETIFEREPFIIRIVEQFRDSFVDFRTTYEPGKSYYPCDIEIALGNSSVSDVLNSTNVLTIKEELRIIGESIDGLKKRIDDTNPILFLNELKTVQQEREMRWASRFEGCAK